MKTTTILLLTAITTALSHTVVAENENSAPPSGPYKASNGTEEMNTSPYSNNNVPPMNYPNQFAMQPQQNRFMPNYPQPEIPEWVKQQQAEMEKLRQQQNSQSAGRTNQPLPPEAPEWVKQRQAEMEKLRQQQNSQSAGRTNQPLPPEAPEWVKQRQAEMEKLR
ncbi:MAG: hypothetical protein OEY61_08865, partial [Gammaproteobacteria bacterium]|nr:hypothetical protein [Gammaproteobacteria bacterium]